MGNSFKSKRIDNVQEGSGRANEVGANVSSKSESSRGRKNADSVGENVAEDNFELTEENAEAKNLRDNEFTGRDQVDDSDLESDTVTLLQHESLKESRMKFLEELKGLPTTFRVVLDCKNSVKEKELFVEGNLLIETVHKLKLCIENQYSIPACCQTITFDCCTLEDQQLLSWYRLRNGDCLRVSFERTGDVSDLMEVIDSVKEMYFLLKSLNSELKNCSLDRLMLLSIEQKIFPQEIEKICKDYISHRLGKGKINHMFFVDCGGLVVLRLLHEELLKYPLAHLPLKLQELETAILSCYWNLTVDTLICQCMQMSRVLQNITKSFLRVKIDSSAPIKTPLNMYEKSNHFRRRNRAEGVAYKSLGVMCNLAEDPRCCLKIASSNEVLNQFVAVMSSPSYGHFYRLVCMGGMLSLSFYTITHPYIASPSVLSGILKYSDTSTCKLLKYFAVVIHAILLASSPQLVSASVKKACLQFDTDFFDTTRYWEIHRIERTYGFIWKTIIPYMIPAYLVYSHPRHTWTSPELTELEAEKLQRYCIQCGIFSLFNVLKSEEMRGIFLQEGLLDYLVCMPWLYPKDWPERKDAEQLVAFISQHIHLQPPSLINIAKAKVAGMYFGLEKVLKADIHELLTEVYA